VAIIRTNWFSKTSPFYYKVRREIDRYSPFDGINDPMDQSQYDFEINQILDIIELEYVELDWFEKSLMDMYLTLGSLSKVSKKTTIPLTSVSNYIRQIRTNLKERIINQLNQQ
jgi:hypothetical protein